MPSDIRAGFSTHRERFRDQWDRVWALSPEERDSLLEHAWRFRSAGGGAEQERVIADLVEEVEAPTHDLSSALGVLDYFGHLHARGGTSVRQSLSELRDLGFLPEETSHEAEEFLTRFLGGLPTRGSRDPRAPRSAAPSRGTGRLARVAAVLAVLALYYLIQYLAGAVALPGRPSLSGEWWLRAFEHHLVQMICALVAIGWLSRGRWRDWGLNLDDREESLRILKRFLLYYGVYFVGIGFVVQWLFFPAPAPPEEMTVRTVTGRLAFGFLFVGVSEEILFRGLIHTFLARFWTGMLRWRRFELPVAGLIAALVFTVAHVGFSLGPLEVTHLSVPQLVMAFGLGIFYSWAYHRTGSLLAPIVAHNLSDGLLWVSEYVLVWLKA